MIWEEIKESLIFFNENAADARDVLNRMGMALIDAGYAKETYIISLLKREQSFPTGLDIGGIGIAIPHTGACHVKKDGIALAVLKEPVKFGKMGTEDEFLDVRLIFMLTVKNPGTHLEYLQKVLEVIRDKTVLSQLINAETAEDVIQIIRKKENGL